jgi:hypothetical protein
MAGLTGITDYSFVLVSSDVAPIASFSSARLCPTVCLMRSCRE